MTTDVGQSTTDVEEYKLYRFLFFLNFSPLIGVLPVPDRKILASAVVKMKFSGELLAFVQKEILWKLGHQPVNEGADMVTSLLHTMDKMYGGKLTSALGEYITSIYPSLPDEGKVFFRELLDMSVIPDNVRKLIKV